jgi:hypothetical protein
MMSQFYGRASLRKRKTQNKSEYASATHKPLSLCEGNYTLEMRRTGKAVTAWLSWKGDLFYYVKR